MNHSIENISFKNNLGQNISGKIYKKNEINKKWLIFCHGLFSTKDGYKITKLANTIVQMNYNLLTFDFSFCGNSDGNIEDISILQELEDLKSAVSYIVEKGAESYHIMGSSMGGVISLLYSCINDNKLASIILISTPVVLKNLLNNNAQDIKHLDDNFISIDGIRLKKDFLQELKDIDIENKIKFIKKPALIFHGEKDQIVKIENNTIFKNSLTSPFKNIIIKNGDHNLTKENDINILKENIIEWIS